MKGRADRDLLATLGAGLFTNGVWDMLSVIVPLYGVAVGLNAAEIGLRSAHRGNRHGGRAAGLRAETDRLAAGHFFDFVADKTADGAGHHHRCIFGIKGTCWLVAKQNTRLRYQCPSKCNSLLFTT